MLTPQQIEEVVQRGMMLHRQGLLDQAEAAYRQIVQAQPRNPAAWNLLGCVLLDRGDPASAAETLSKAIALDRRNPDLHNNLGNALLGLNRISEAIGCYRKAISFSATHVGAWNNLGNALFQTQDYDAALRCFQRAAAIDPAYADAYNGIGDVHRARGDTPQAITFFRKAIELDPSLGEAHGNLANLLQWNRDFDGALHHFQQALALRPNRPRGYYSIASCLLELGRQDGSIAALREGLRRDPADLELLSALAFTALLREPFDPAYALAQATAFGDRAMTVARASSVGATGNPPDPDRRLRIGYVSGDFREHAMAYRIAPILAHHDRAMAEVYCYQANPASDEATGRLQGMADRWRQIGDADDDTFCTTVRSDGIDILVDLSGHGVHNRLAALARSPAPIQVLALGYLGTSGVPGISYRLCDDVSDPAPIADSHHSEKLLRIPRTQFCCALPVDAPAVSAAPIAASGQVTFGSFNNFVRVTAAQLALWAGVLSAVPGARLNLLGVPQGSATKRVIEAFAVHGIEPARLDIRDQVSRSEYWQALARVDIALDTYPYAGETTTIECLWMGVPVVTLAGLYGVSRSGASILNAVELHEFVASSAGGYLDIAIKLAADRERLLALRAQLRPRVRSSPLLDGVGFVRELEALYRRIWIDWCAKRAAGAGT